MAAISVISSFPNSAYNHVIRIFIDKHVTLVSLNINAFVKNSVERFFYEIKDF